MNPNIIQIVDHPSIIRSTSIKLAEGLRPRRIVLRKLPGKFVTHSEHLTIRVVETSASPDRKYDCVVCEHEDFDQGNYFEFHNEASEKIALTKAEHDFETRAARL
jgi:hypothetical protein